MYISLRLWDLIFERLSLLSDLLLKKERRHGTFRATISVTIVYEPQQQNNNFHVFLFHFEGNKDHKVLFILW